MLVPMCFAGRTSKRSGRGDRKRDNTMAQPLERLFATGRQLTESGRTQAQQLRTDLVDQGRQATDQISAVVEQLVNPVGRYRGEDWRETVHAEVQQEVR